jgi:alpha-L-fucosidase
MKRSLFLFLVLIHSLVDAQKYTADWSSLDARPTPQWFQDGKFGIFIHWGVYSVPGWSSKGNYAEWYQQGLQTTDSARKKFHQNKFGDRSYYQLADDFKAELYDPEAWAKLFERSGAKYIVLTSKHHDGFALWPSKEASTIWGFPWNAAEAGPKRDLLGDLFRAVRKTSVHAGMYYSLYEWFNPLWKKDPSRFATEHTWPQMKDLILNYQPDVFWTDGDWDASAETWKSREFLAWLYNESPVKEKVVVNDRWGSGMRFKHGGIYTPEYQPNLDFEDHYWEESRGMGYSYGYNREEDAWDYNSTRSLVIALIDKVSRGGNFLLDIGPDEHGKIPPIMQERLLQIGDWMQINGEAIYGTTRWKTPVQWSTGKKDIGNAHKVPSDWNDQSDIMLKQTVDPDPGYAVKEIFYTYKPVSNTLYAIFPKYPSGRKLLLRDLTLPSGTNIYFTSLQNRSLSWEQKGTDVEVQLPEYDPALFSAPYAYAIRIENYGKFTAKPQMEISYPVGGLKPVITLSHSAGARIYYTLDGSIPGLQGNLYTKPIQLEKSGGIRALAVSADALPSSIVEKTVNAYEWLSAERVKGTLQKGLQAQVFELQPTSTKDLETATPILKAVADKIGLQLLRRQENTGLRFEGYVRIPEDALYNFYLSSDDGSRLWIDGKEIIDHDGMHGNDEKEGAAALRKGYHRIRVDFIQATGGIDLVLKYSSASVPKQEIPAERYFCR